MRLERLDKEGNYIDEDEEVSEIEEGPEEKFTYHEYDPSVDTVEPYPDSDFEDKSYQPHLHRGLSARKFSALELKKRLSRRAKLHENWDKENLKYSARVVYELLSTILQTEKKVPQHKSRKWLKVPKSSFELVRRKLKDQALFVLGVGPDPERVALGDLSFVWRTEDKDWLRARFDKFTLNRRAIPHNWANFEEEDFQQYCRRSRYKGHGQGSLALEEDYSLQYERMDLSNIAEAHRAVQYQTTLPGTDQRHEPESEDGSTMKPFYPRNIKEIPLQHGSDADVSDIEEISHTEFKQKAKIVDLDNEAAKAKADALRWQQQFNFDYVPSWDEMYDCIIMQVIPQDFIQMLDKQVPGTTSETERRKHNFAVWISLTTYGQAQRHKRLRLTSDADLRANGRRQRAASAEFYREVACQDDGFLMYPSISPTPFMADLSHEESPCARVLSDKKKRRRRITGLDSEDGDEWVDDEHDNGHMMSVAEKEDEEME